jgi:hypothetical protein
MSDDEFSAARGITTAVIISLVFWGTILFGAMLWLS